MQGVDIRLHEGAAWVLVVAGLMSWPAYAQEASRAAVDPLAVRAGAPAEAPRTVAVGVATLKEHGFGVVLRARRDHVALDLAAGLAPVLVITNLDLYAAMPVHADASFVFFFSDADRRFQQGVRLGAAWDAIVGGGALVGWVGDLTWRQLVIGFGAGLQYYPDFESGVREHFDLEGASFEGSLTTVQPYLGVNLCWYLL